MERAGQNSFGKGISNHEVCPERDQRALYAGSIELPTIINTHVNVAGRFTADRISRYNNTSQIVLINIIRVRRRANIVEKGPQILNFLANLTSGHVFGFRRGESNRILTTGFP